MKKITHDDIADIGLAAVDKLVELGLIPDCTDTDDETEFEAQDAIRDAITAKLEALGYTISGSEDETTYEWKNAEYGAEIESLVGKEPVRMSKAYKEGGTNNYTIIVNGTFYFYKTEAERDADYRQGSSMVVQIIKFNLDKL